MMPYFARLALVASLLAAFVKASFESQAPLQDDLSENILPYWRLPPAIGFGTWNLNRTNATEAVSLALRTGYRHIDCATAYGNQKLVGAGISDGMRKARLRRNDIWVTSKLWNDHHDPSLVLPALKQTLVDLRLSYLDLYLMHWPVSSPPSTTNTTISYLSTWTAMVQLLRTNRVRFIGISNFSPAQLDALLAHNPHHPPHVHQMELHPYLQQRDWIAYHTARGIHVTGYSPLGGTNPTYDGPEPGLPVPLLENEVIRDVAHKRHCTPAQVAIAWGAGRRTSVIPKSSHADRIKENHGAETCDLRAEDRERIAELGEVAHRYNNPSKQWGLSLYEGLEGA